MIFHVISLENTKELEKITNKRDYIYSHFGVIKIWYEIHDKDKLRKKYGFTSR